VQLIGWSYNEVQGLWVESVKIELFLLWWQVFHGVNGLARFSDFKMKCDLIRVRVAHLRNLLPLFDQLVLFDQKDLVVSVGTEVSFIVFQDDQVAVASKSRACIDHLPICCGQHCLARFVANVNALVFKEV